MSSQDIPAAVIALAIVILMLYLPRRFSRRHRVTAGLALFVSGWAGLFLGLALSDLPFLQNDIIAYGWAGSCAVATLLATVLLVPAGFEWFRSARPRRRRREKWPNR